MYYTVYGVYYMYKALVKLRSLHMFLTVFGSDVLQLHQQVLF